MFHGQPNAMSVQVQVIDHQGRAQIVARQHVLSGGNYSVSIGDEANVRLVNPRHGLGATCTACSVSYCDGNS